MDTELIEMEGEAHTHNPLKRPWDDSKQEEEEEEEEEEDPYIGLGYNEKDKGDRESGIVCLIQDLNLQRLSDLLKNDLEFEGLCRDIIQCLQKKVFSDADAEFFSKRVNAVLEHMDFLEGLFMETENDICFYGVLMYNGEVTQSRAETIQERVSLIKKDKYFFHATKIAEKKTKLLIRGCLSIIIGYCISKDDLKKMTQRLGKVAPPLIWGTIGYGLPEGEDASMLWESCSP